MTAGTGGTISSVASAALGGGLGGLAGGIVGGFAGKGVPVIEQPGRLIDLTKVSSDYLLVICQHLKVIRKIQEEIYNKEISSLLY